MRDVVRTVAYFSLAGQAITQTDCWRWLYRPTQPWSLEAVLKAVRLAEEAGHVSLRDGRVVLRGQESLFLLSHPAFLDAHKKWRTARRVAWWASWIPGVRAVAIGNTLAWEATQPTSDIDVFVIARAGSLWLVRFLCVVPLMVLRARPGVRQRDAIDFTFFVADTQLAFETLCIAPEDPYLTYWIASLVPLVDDGVMQNLWDQNPWVSAALPHAHPVVLAWYRRVRHGQQVGAWLYRMMKVAGVIRVGNAGARWLSMRWFPTAIRSQMNQSSAVVVHEGMLKFHVQDSRQARYDAWIAYVE